MKLLSRNTDYAVRAVCYIANCNDKIVTVAQLVKTLKIPQPFLRKILQVLNNKRLLRSYKGSGGGFRLAKNPENIYLNDLMEIFQGPFRLNECYFKKEVCPNKRSCFLKKKVDEIERSVVSKLCSITIGSILKGE